MPHTDISAVVADTSIAICLSKLACGEERGRYSLAFTLDLQVQAQERLIQPELGRLSSERGTGYQD